MRRSLAIILVLAFHEIPFIGYGGEREQPNILLFLVDDMGVTESSAPFIFDRNGKPCHQKLNDWYRTPHIERLAEQGVRMREFYAHSVCSPSRISIMTGQNSARHRTTNYIGSYTNNRNRFGPKKWNWKGIGADDFTLPKLLKKAGYRTIHIGKAHFGPFKHVGANPLNLGFDFSVGGSAIGMPGSYYAKRKYGKGTACPVPDLEKYWGSDTFLTEALTREAIGALENHLKSSEKPFFLYMAHYALHRPLQPDPRFIEHYAKEGVPKDVQAFSTLIEGMDRSLGDILDFLRKKGVAKKTLVIFMGDNGSDSPVGGWTNPFKYKSSKIGGSAPLRGKKGSRWEGGVRVPFIAAWAEPDDQQPLQKRVPILRGSVNLGWGACYDLLPTLAEVVGEKIPESWKVDGISLLPVFNSPTWQLPERSFLSHYPHEHCSDYFTILRFGEWKIIREYDPAGKRFGGKIKDELYNIIEDVSESHDLSQQEPERLAAMRKRLEKSLKDHHALLPERINKRRER